MANTVTIIIIIRSSCGSVLQGCWLTICANAKASHFMGHSARLGSSRPWWAPWAAAGTCTRWLARGSRRQGGALCGSAAFLMEASLGRAPPRPRTWASSPGHDEEWTSHRVAVKAPDTKEASPKANEIYHWSKRAYMDLGLPCVSPEMIPWTRDAGDSPASEGCWLPDCSHWSTRTLRAVGCIQNHPHPYSGAGAVLCPERSCRSWARWRIARQRKSLVGAHDAHPLLQTARSSGHRMATVIEVNAVFSARSRPALKTLGLPDRGWSVGSTKSEQLHDVKSVITVTFACVRPWNRSTPIWYLGWKLTILSLQDLIKRMCLWTTHPTIGRRRQQDEKDKNGSWDHRRDREWSRKYLLFGGGDSPRVDRISQSTSTIALTKFRSVPASTVRTKTRSAPQWLNPSCAWMFRSSGRRAALSV